MPPWKTQDIKMIKGHCGINSRKINLTQLTSIPSWVWLIIGLIGLGLTAHEDIFARIKARQAALELHGTISN